MAPKGSRTGSAAPLRSHSRSSSATRVSANLQFTQKDSASGKASDKSKKNPHAREGERPGFTRANSSQRVPPAGQVKRTGSSTSATQHKTNANVAKASTGFTLTTQTTDDDEDEWVSSSGAATPNQDDSDSDTASEGSSIPQELVEQLQRTQLEQRRQKEAATARAQALLPRVDTARQLDFDPMTTAVVASDGTGHDGVAKSAPAPTQTPFPTTNSEPNGPLQDPSSKERYQSRPRSSYAADHVIPVGGGKQSTREANHTRSESRQTHSSSSRQQSQSVTRPPSTHSVSSRLENLRPHPLIRGHSQGYLNLVPKPTPLAPLTVITDQPASASENLSASPESIKTTVTSPGGYTTEFPAGRRTSFSSARSVATVPAQSVVQPTHYKQYDRTRTLSTMSTSASSSALNSLAHLPSVTRPPSPQQISFFPPVNPHINIEAIHPLLPGPYLSNHLTVLARRIPLRESYDRVIQAKIASNR